MKILHYFLGFPPYRTGGLTRFAYDLMQSQVNDGHIVSALWPGQMGIINHKTLIKERKEIAGIKNYELINPLPVSLDEGIIEFDAYMQNCDLSVYESFLKIVSPEAIHVHTLMGLHKQFIDAANKLNIRTVFTTHDYFGICPKVTLYRYGAACENDHECKDCIQCNYSALSLKKITIMQSSIYRELKNFTLVKWLRKQHRKDFFANETFPEMAVSDVLAIAKKYRKLRAYYKYMFENIDCIHFNSSVTETIYKKYVIPKSSVIMTITHKSIADNRDACKWRPSNILRLTLLAPAKPFKGYNILRIVLDELWESGRRDFVLRIYSPVQNPRPYMSVKENGFSQNELPEIFKETDVLVAPSIWYETFGFTVLEAISYGVPVIVSDHVGAKDILRNGGIIVKAGDIEELKDAINNLDQNMIVSLRKTINQNIPVKTWKEFINQNYRLYRKIHIDCTDN